LKFLTKSHGQEKLLTKKAPDSITDWLFNAYCLSDEYGIGVATKPVTLNVFQPFFVSVNLPYSAVRGEILPIQASVFNYLNKHISVCMPA
jgi:CD109 antigen